MSSSPALHTLRFSAPPSPASPSYLPYEREPLGTADIPAEDSAHGLSGERPRERVCSQAEGEAQSARNYLCIKTFKENLLQSN